MPNKEILTRLVTLANNLDRAGLMTELNSIEKVIENYANETGLAPRELKSDPMAGYTDPASVKVHTKRPKDTPLPPRKKERPMPAVVELDPPLPPQHKAQSALEAYERLQKEAEELAAQPAEQPAAQPEYTYNAYYQENPNRRVGRDQKARGILKQVNESNMAITYLPQTGPVWGNSLAEVQSKLAALAPGAQITHNAAEQMWPFSVTGIFPFTLDGQYYPG